MNFSPYTLTRKRSGYLKTASPWLAKTTGGRASHHIRTQASDLCNELRWSKTHTMHTTDFRCISVHKSTPGKEAPKSHTSRISQVSVRGLPAVSAMPGSPDCLLFRILRTEAKLRDCGGPAETSICPTAEIRLGMWWGSAGRDNNRQCTQKYYNKTTASVDGAEWFLYWCSEIKKYR